MSTRSLMKEERNLRSIAPSIAGLLSLVVPGLGQAVIGYWERGLIMISNFIALIALILWRIYVIAYKQTTWRTRILVAFDRQPVLWVLLIALLAMWGYIIFDAVRASDRHTGRANIVYGIISIMFFMLGWQIIDIDMVKLVTEFPDALPIISRIAWPWPAAIVREEIIVQGEELLFTACDADDDLPLHEPESDQPTLDVSPRCGTLSTYEQPGTLVHVEGQGFLPNQEVVMWWTDPVGKAFRVRYHGDFITAQADDQGAFTLDFAMPNVLVPPSAGEGPQRHRLQARQTYYPGGFYISKELKLAIEKMVETIFLGMMATLFGVTLAIPVSFLAAHNLMDGSPLTLTIYYFTRFILNIVRSIEPIIWAIIAILWVGLGPFAGVIALTLHTIAALGKLYSESIESINPGPIEAVHAVGANWFQTIVYAVIPQIVPPFVSFTIYRWDINIRMSTIIGAVGGGGIGFLLMQWIRLTDYRAAGIAVWFIAITVAILDFVSAKIRERYV